VFFNFLCLPITTKSIGHFTFRRAFTVAQLQGELKISEANARTKLANLSESEFPEFYNSQNKDPSPFISHSFLFVPTAIL
jgi:hypothetical protein